MLHLTRKVVRREGFLFFSAFCDDSVAKFEDRVPEKPLSKAYYNKRYLEDLVGEAGWALVSWEEPAAYIMSSFLCKPV
jgi:hypothetical protein